MTKRILTSSWFTLLPPKHTRIGVSRGIPKGATQFKLYRTLQPGSWFKSVSRTGLSAVFVEAFHQLLDESRGVGVTNRTPRLAKTVKRSV